MYIVNKTYSAEARAAKTKTVRMMTIFIFSSVMFSDWFLSTLFKSYIPSGAATVGQIRKVSAMNIKGFKNFMSSRTIYFGCSTMLSIFYPSNDSIVNTYRYIYRKYVSNNAHVYVSLLFWVALNSTNFNCFSPFLLIIIPLQYLPKTFKNWVKYHFIISVTTLGLFF